ncbi:MAG: NAD-dependent epimerase/dehydratase family protein [Candidatus Nomurabacteria bacterium]|nr:NAD-dependent epimerase/dehydratase family protein [Candidatus Nomurabacteria bacterium]
MENTKKVFITGATGFVGQNLVNSLIKKEYEIYVLTRNGSSIFSNNKNVNIIIGDITDDISIPEDIDTIYHCAGVVSSKYEMERINILGTENIVKIALKNKCKLIYLSSAGVIGKTKKDILDETTVCNPENDYEISKYKAEQIVLKGIQNGLKAQILRPTTIFGIGQNSKNDSFFQLVKSIRTGLYKNINTGIYNIVHIDEVIKALELLDEENLPNGEIYIVNNTIRYKDMNLIVKNLQPVITKNTQSIPYPIAYIATVVLTIFCFLINKKNPLTFSRLKALTNKKIYSQSKIEKTIAFKNTLPIEGYIKSICEKYISLKLIH